MDSSNYEILAQCVDELNFKNNMTVQVHKAEPIMGKYGLVVPNRPDIKNARVA